MLFPVVSGRRLVRLQNSDTIREITELYTSVVATWMYAEDNEMPEEEFMGIWAPKFREKLLATSAKLYGLRSQTALAKWEGSLRGNWPYLEYAKLVETQVEMTGAVAQVRHLLFPGTPIR